MGESSLYPALQRALLNDWVPSRFYKVTAAGRKQLASEAGEFRRLAGAIARVLETA